MTHKAPKTETQSFKKQRERTVNKRRGSVFCIVIKAWTPYLSFHRLSVPLQPLRGGFSAESKRPQDRQDKPLVATAVYAATVFHLTSEVAPSVFVCFPFSCNKVFYLFRKDVQS